MVALPLVFSHPDIPTVINVKAKSHNITTKHLFTFVLKFNIMSNKFFLIFIGIVFLSFASCKRNRNQIPYVNVDIYVYPSQPAYINLNIVGGWLYLSGGYKGIIVYRSTQDEFIAYDRACTYDPTEECSLVEVTKDNVTAVDSCCMSQFLITDGNVFSGVATQPLQRYRADYDGVTLHIYN